MSAVTPLQAVRLIAGREIVTRLRTKSFLISNAVLVVLIVGGIIVASALSGGTDDGDRVGLVGRAGSLSQALSSSAQAVGTTVTPSEVADEQTARASVTAGDLDVALVPGVDGAYTAITEEDLSDTLRAALDATVRQAAVSDALQAQGVDPGVLTAATAGATVTVDALDPPDAVNSERLALAYVSVLLLYVQLLQSGVSVASGVVEEKTSRVVELLLSTVKPLHLLVGKVLGIGTVGLVQLAVYGVAGIGAALGTGLLTLTGAAISVFVGTLGWFVLGYAFYAVLYAAAGSMVSRQEEIGATTTPLTVLVIAMFALAQAAVQDPTGTVSSVMSWIPPFSAILMPLRIAAGVTGPAQVLGTAVLMLAVTSLLAVGAASIYRRSVVRSGARVRWREALGRS